MTVRRATRHVLSRARRVFGAARHGAGNVRSRAHGYIFAFLRGRWITGAYEVYLAAIKVVSNGVTLWAPRIQALPARFQALLMLRRGPKDD